MSKQKRENQVQVSIVGGQKPAESMNGQAADATSQTSRSSWLLYLRTHWWAVAIIAFLSLGTFGAGLRYLEDDAKRQQLNQPNLTADLKNQSLLNRVNPFIPAPLPSPTPQLAKEYVYAGSRLLAVEDVNANAGLAYDFAIWRPSAREWMVLNSQTLYMDGVIWGDIGDIFVPGDYDGDGKADFAAFRPSTNEWHIIRSNNSSGLFFNFGQAGDKPVVADYDGDGYTDAAVFRPSNGTWLVRQSSDGMITGFQFGNATDIFTPGDYEGDGKADYAVFRPSEQTWYVWQSSTNTYYSVPFGLSTDIPVAADYDGDGKTDLAMRRGADWIIRNSSDLQIQTITWQQASDIAVPNDYDGDGKADIATWRDSNGTWYIRQSGLNGQLRQQGWGQSGDIPVPASYRR